MRIAVKPLSVWTEGEGEPWGFRGPVCRKINYSSKQLCGLPVPTSSSHFLPHRHSLLPFSTSSPNLRSSPITRWLVLKKKREKKNQPHRLPIPISPSNPLPYPHPHPPFPSCLSLHSVASIIVKKKRKKATQSSTIYANIAFQPSLPQEIFLIAYHVAFGLFFIFFFS